MLELTAYIKIFTTLLAIVNPLGAIPIFISLTGTMASEERRRIINTASITVVVVLIVSALLGKPLLDFFGISIASFKVGGGILLLLMAISMMQATYAQTKQTREEEAEAEEKGSIAVVPIAMPLLAGPGAISTIIIYADASPHVLHITLLIISSVLVAGLTWIALNIASPLRRVMSKTAINIATRLMGLLLAAIAVEFIAGGLTVLFPGLR
ncbi:MAG: YchE family NAAT transporter [Nitrospirae bacterium]|nr:YchE family NAAT transporter [Nitrospirota bacterium]